MDDGPTFILLALRLLCFHFDKSNKLGNWELSKLSELNRLKNSIELINLVKSNY